MDYGRQRQQKHHSHQKSIRQKRIRKWFALIGAVIMVAGGMALLTACGGEAQSPHGPGGHSGQEQQAGSQAQGQTQSVSEDVWKSAYREVLEANESSIRGYETGMYEGDTKDATALCDLNHDGVPELLFGAWAEENMRAALNIYTCGENGAEQVDYVCTPAQSYEGQEDNEPFYDVYAAGGTEYIVYSEKDSNRFAIYSTITDEMIFTQLNRYEMDGNGAVKELESIGYRFDFVVYDGENYLYTAESVDYDDAAFYRNGKDSDKETWLQGYESSRDAMDQVIIIKGGSRGDDSAIWDKAEETGSIAKSYDEMMNELQTESADTAKADKPNAEAAAYGETMEKVLDAYAKGDMKTAREYNAKLPENAMQANVTAEAKAAYDAAHDQLEDNGQLSEFEESFYCDVDNDGQGEYLVKTGTCEADFMLQCYTFKDGEAKWIGETGAGHSVFSQYPNHNGIIQEYGHMGYEGISVITFSGGEAQYQEIGSREEISDGDDYLHLGCMLGN